MWERLFAVIPQILDDYFPSDGHELGSPLRHRTNLEEEPMDKSLRSAQGQEPTSPLIPNASVHGNSHNSQAIAMYHRAMTLQRGNSENMNQHIFAPPILIQSASNSFEVDEDQYQDSDCCSVSSAVSSALSESGDSAQSVLSEEEYLDLHFRMNFDELSSSLYEESDEDSMDRMDRMERMEVLPHQPSWVELRRRPLDDHDDNDRMLYEVTVCPETGKLDETDWRTLVQFLEDNEMEHIALSLCNVVLEETASHWLCRLNQRAGLKALSVDHGHFAHRRSREEDFVAFAQNEGNEGARGRGRVEVEEQFDFKAFCRSMLENGDLESVRITASNLEEMLTEKEGGKEVFIDLLSTHHGLKRVSLADNKLSDGTLFVDALMMRTLPLEHLDLSFNPIPREDVQSIEWAATKHCGSQFVLDVPFANGLKPLDHIHGGDAVMVMEPALDYNQYDDVESADSDERDEREFMSSLFPTLSSVQRRWFPMEMEQKEEVEAPGIDGLDRLELGIEVARPRRARSNRKRVICREFVFVSPEGDEVRAHCQHDGRGHDGGDGHGHGQDHGVEDQEHGPGTLGQDGERERNAMSYGAGQSMHHLMLRI